ncbi:MAG: hypothetical protein IT350_14300 [Deltaproteobacteria bacterium]|nr:hypothetical protein [Deltaproteobacteria bacterium]
MTHDRPALFDDPLLDERLAFWAGILIRETDFAQAAQMVLRDAASVFGLVEVESTQVGATDDGTLVGVPVWEWCDRRDLVDHAVDIDNPIDVAAAKPIGEEIAVFARRGDPFAPTGPETNPHAELIVPIAPHGALEHLTRFRLGASLQDCAVTTEALRRLGHWFFDAYTRSVEIRRWQAVKALELEISRRSILTSLNQTMEHRENLRRANELLERQNRELVDANRLAQESNRLKSEFLATTSHELRTPLNAILGFLSFYIANPEAGEAERLECVQTAHGSAQQLLETINKVLEIANIESGRTSAAPMEFPVIYLFQEIDRVFGPKVRAKNLEWRLEMPDDIDLSAFANLPKLRESVMNVLANALKFTAEGFVSLRAEAEPNGFTRIEVRDSGIGFTEDVARRLFTPFSQADAGLARKFGGTGLGLAIAKKLLELMGGSIDVHSDGPGLGARVAIRVPSGPSVDVAPASVVPISESPEAKRISESERVRVLLCGLSADRADDLAKRADEAEFAFDIAADSADARGRIESGDVDALVCFLDNDENAAWCRDVPVAGGVPTVVVTSFDERKIQDHMEWLSSPAVLIVVQLDRVERDGGPVLRALSKLRRRMLGGR